MKPFILALAAIAFASAAHAADEAQAERAAACGVTDAAIAASLERDELVQALEARATYATRGDGPVQIIEFFDYSCPGCRALHPQLVKVAADAPQTRTHVIDFPIFAKTAVSRLTGNKTGNASLIGLAALEEGDAVALAYHDALMSTSGRVTTKKIKASAAEAGLDYDALSRRAQDDDIAAIPRENIAYAEELGIRGTPGLVIDGVILSPDDFSGPVISCLIKSAVDALPAS